MPMPTRRPRSSVYSRYAKPETYCPDWLLADKATPKPVRDALAKLDKVNAELADAYDAKVEALSKIAAHDEAVSAANAVGDVPPPTSERIAYMEEHAAAERRHKKATIAAPAVATAADAALIAHENELRAIAAKRCLDADARVRELWEQFQAAFAERDEAYSAAGRPVVRNDRGSIVGVRPWDDTELGVRIPIAERQYGQAVSQFPLDAVQPVALGGKPEVVPTETEESERERRLRAIRTRRDAGIAYFGG
ncbi:hypothetical protein [Streptomyces shenzhenensis]|uniref:hypothetical protein n=1 Tax=Streptomyces shenzhenensis TaxID=943815 RepID=UPI0015F0B0D8|nr:hypothetical protein [Streptomyces shenzhenensis]